MSHRPFLSIITVSYNSAATIGRTLESLRQQTHKNFESILIDGGSSDATMEIVKSYEDVVTKSISEKDRGIYDAMNKGIALAEGKYLAFLNSDDAYFPETIARVIAFAEKQSAEIIYGNMQKERKLGNEILTRVEKPDLKKMPETMGIFHPATFVKKELFERFGGYDLRFKLAADYHWLLRAYLQKADFKYIDEVLVKFSVGGASNFSCDTYREAIQIQEELKTGTADTMRDLYKICLRKHNRQRMIAKLARLPILRNIYRRQIKKRWD